MAKINIVMAAFNQCEMTDRTIMSVLKNTKSDFRFIIINNGSTDSTHDMIHEKYIDDLRITYIKEDKNRGCGIGRNVGLKILDSDCQYVFLIDNDIYVPDGWDEKLIKFMDKYPRIGLGGPSTNFAGSPQLIKDLPSLETNEDIERYAAAHRSAREYSPVPEKWPVIGFCQIIRKQIFDKIGIFDENFELYGCEDNDFCYRVEKAGWKLAYIDSIFVYHHGHGGLSLLGDDGIEQWGKNREYFKEKHGFI